ncbi:hypothetical protein GpartN1_g7022.t1 [Galdieria partita]|uniref:Uncharacterized protein n=1 Tax=Galdieria partita TaxID=83374 RepID=A0A9C7Q2W2_9RHOD|nr:hypothetical protein GpartN1_g7022.t1 [Galdieria partita]
MSSTAKDNEPLDSTYQLIQQLQNIQQDLNHFIQQTSEEMERMVENVASHMDIANRAVLGLNVEQVEKKTVELSLALQQTRDKLLYVDVMAEKVNRLKSIVLECWKRSQESR